MLAYQPDQRAARRYAMDIPVCVRLPHDSESSQARTRDVSSRGICFYTDALFDSGSLIEFTLTLPSEITMTEAVRVRCQGRIVRVEDGDGLGRLKVAAQIEQYEFISTN